MSVENEELGEPVAALLDVLETVKVLPHGHPASQTGRPVPPERCPVCSTVDEALSQFDGGRGDG